MAAQLTATKGPSERRLARCMARARSSFPVPLAPWMRTLASFAPPVLVARAARGPREPQRLLHLLEQVLPVEGLGLKAEDPAPGGGHRVGDRAVRGQDDDGQHRRLLADLIEKRKPVDAAHLEVGDDELRTRRGERGERLFAAVHRLDPVARGTEAQRHELQNVRVVVDEKNRVHFGRACSRSMILRSIAFSASSCSFSCAARRCSRRRSLIWA